MHKHCKKRGVEKPLSEFYAKKSGKDGKSATCKACGAKANSDWRSKNKEVAAAKTREWLTRNPGKSYEYHCKKYQSVDGRAWHLFTNAKKRMPSDFSLTLEHVTLGVAAGFCSVTGLPFDLRVNHRGKGNRSWSPFAPSLDRINSRKGYSDENTRVVIWQYNVMKGELSDVELVQICKIVVARVGQ